MMIFKAGRQTIILTFQEGRLLLLHNYNNIFPFVNFLLFVWCYIVSCYSYMLSLTCSFRLLSSGQARQENYFEFSTCSRCSDSLTSILPAYFQRKPASLKISAQHNLPTFQIHSIFAPVSDLAKMSKKNIIHHFVRTSGHLRVSYVTSHPFTVIIMYSRKGEFTCNIHGRHQHLLIL